MWINHQYNSKIIIVSLNPLPLYLICKILNPVFPMKVFIGQFEYFGEKREAGKQQTLTSSWLYANKTGTESKIKIGFSFTKS